MPFTTISTAELAPGKPITTELLNAFKDRDEFLNGVVGTLQQNGIINGSFEVDSDGDGLPDSWDVTFFTGGTGALDTSTSDHGKTSMKLVHPGGVGNGGGQISSTFINITGGRPNIRMSRRNSNAATKTQIQIKYYDKGLSSIASTIINASTANSTRWEDIYISNFVKPSSAVFAKLVLYGGTTDKDAAGTVWFDNIELVEGFSPTLLIGSTASFSISIAPTTSLAKRSSASMAIEENYNTMHIPTSIFCTSSAGGATSNMTMEWRIYSGTTKVATSQQFTVTRASSSESSVVSTYSTLTLDVSGLATGAYSLELWMGASAIGGLTTQRTEATQRQYFTKKNSTVDMLTL